MSLDLRLAAIAALLALTGACAPKSGDDQTSTPTDESAPQPAAATGLPIAHILRGDVVADEGGEGISVVDIGAILDSPGYQNQPAFFGADGHQFYYVAENENAKTDLWAYDLRSGETRQITQSPERSEYSPKPAPDGGVSFIQESDDGEMTRVHLIGEAGGPGAAVVENGPVGYYEWLQSGASVAVFYRSEPPMLQIIDVATGATRDVFDNVGRVLMASPDGATLFAARASEDGAYHVMAVDVASGDFEPVIDLPPGAQDFYLTFEGGGLPAVAFSSMGTRVMTYDFASDSVWHVAADISELGYGAISRVAVANASDNPRQGAIVFVAHPAEG